MLSITRENMNPLLHMFPQLTTNLLQNYVKKYLIKTNTNKYKLTWETSTRGQNTNPVSKLMQMVNLWFHGCVYGYVLSVSESGCNTACATRRSRRNHPCNHGRRVLLRRRNTNFALVARFIHRCLLRLWIKKWKIKGLKDRYYKRLSFVFIYLISNIYF